MKKKKPVISAGYLVRKPSDDLGMALHRSTIKVIKRYQSLEKTINNEEEPQDKK